MVGEWDRYGSGSKHKKLSELFFKKKFISTHIVGTITVEHIIMIKKIFNCEKEVFFELLTDPY